MSPRSPVTLILLSLLMSMPVMASAESGRDKAKSRSEIEARAQETVDETVDETAAEQREEMREKDRARRQKDRDVLVDGGADVEDARDQDEDVTDGARHEVESRRSLRDEGAETKGNERAQEMRARRDERKAIKEEYKSDRAAGQESDLARSYDDDADETVDDAADEAKKKPKKSWWKFWDD